MVGLFAVTSIKASPIQIAQLFDEARRSKQPLDSLRAIYSAGSVMPGSLRRTIRAESTARLFNLYGSTEVGRAAERELTDDDTSFAGFVVSGTDLEIVDRHDRAVDTGMTGMVRYRRAHMAVEYLDDHVSTAHAFRNGWFYTGDEGILDADGRLSLTGRTSEVINVGGVKVQPRDAEELALNEAGVADAAGFSFSGLSGVTQFALAVVARPDHAFDGRELARLMSSHLGVLAPTLIFELPSLPRNPAGKVDRDELDRIYSDATSH
jgi:acyl-coenzyme A synthetase/AMP-(fatty) acid ligase